MKDLQRAFVLGFLCSREGFNGECPNDHLAPETIIDKRSFQEDLAEMSDGMAHSDEFQRLWQEANRHFKGGDE